MSFERGPFPSLEQLHDNRSDGAKEVFLGSHRTVAPSETVARVNKLMSWMGITRLANVTGLDRIGVPVVMVCRPNARSLAVSQGKGIDLAAAAASGLMEAAELYHAEHIDLPLKLGSYSELAQSHAFVDVDRLPKVSDIPFDQNLVTLWIEGVDLFSGTSRWVPFESVRTNFTLPLPPGSGYFDCSSNGLASGNTMVEAVCHAICEVVERDATALWNRIPSKDRARTGLNLDSVADEACREVLGKLERTEFDVTAWETTSDVGVPAFFCLITDRRSPRNHHGVGAGAHPAPGIALLRALTEAIQVRTTYISGARDDLLPEEYTETERARKARVAARLRAEHLPERDFGAIPDRSSDNFADDLAWLLSRLRAVDVREVVAVDLSKSWLGLSIVRIVVPGLEGPDDHDAYVPGERTRRLLGGAS
ncbi:YcaO-like family protein [Chelativorans sp. M5D2P16]|uniref:YcaO-like family protein n=1 Tax=Chelativorans sp. M5D2P16 TaxID=3095678 RepID=UPI002ACA6508|nr:YcaO-like family protein [Chelativorans sp. M5D2P16]MDZ5697900.1 YcaO-like family protein [Chelativorans sp. M5D2P16]